MSARNGRHVRRAVTGGRPAERLLAGRQRPARRWPRPGRGSASWARIFWCRARSAADGSRPSSSSRTTRVRANTSSASACRPDWYRAVISSPASVSWVGSAPTTGSSSATTSADWPSDSSSCARSVSAARRSCPSRAASTVAHGWSAKSASGSPPHRASAAPYSAAASPAASSSGLSRRARAARTPLAKASMSTDSGATSTRYPTPSRATAASVPASARRSFDTRSCSAFDGSAGRASPHNRSMSVFAVTIRPGESSSSASSARSAAPGRVRGCPSAVMPMGPRRRNSTWPGPGASVTATSFRPPRQDPGRASQRPAGGRQHPWS